MGDPVTATLGAKAGASIFGGLAGRSAAKGEQQRAEANAFIGETRAIQTDSVSRRVLEDDLSTARNVFASNEQEANVSVLGILDEIREESNRSRRIAVGGERTRAADFRLQAANAGARGTGAVIGGAIRAAPSIFDLVQYRT